MRANDWFDESQGNFYAAGLTYYTIFALFPLLMVGFSAVAGAAPMAHLLKWLGIDDLPGLDVILRAVSVLVSFLLSCFVFGWMIARLPRIPVNFASAVRAALLAAAGFEVFKLVGTIYL